MAELDQTLKTFRAEMSCHETQHRGNHLTMISSLQIFMHFLISLCCFQELGFYFDYDCYLYLNFAVQGSFGSYLKQQETILFLLKQMAQVEQ